MSIGSVPSLMDRLRAKRLAERGQEPLNIGELVVPKRLDIPPARRSSPSKGDVKLSPIAWKSYQTLKRPAATCATCGIVVGGKQKDVRYCRPCWKVRERELHQKYYQERTANRPPKPEVPCARCGTVFVQRTVRIRHCSDRCHEAERNETALARRREKREGRVTPLPKPVTVKPGSAMEAEIAHNAERRKPLGSD